MSRRKRSRSSLKETAGLGKNSRGRGVRVLSLESRKLYVIGMEFFFFLLHFHFLFTLVFFSFFFFLFLHSGLCLLSEFRILLCSSSVGIVLRGGLFLDGEFGGRSNKQVKTLVIAVSLLFIDHGLVRRPSPFFSFSFSFSFFLLPIPI